MVHIKGPYHYSGLRVRATFLPPSPIDFGEGASCPSHHHQLGVWGSAVSSPNGVWGKAPAEIKFDAY